MNWTIFLLTLFFIYIFSGNFLIAFVAAVTAGFLFRKKNSPPEDPPRRRGTKVGT